MTRTRKVVIVHCAKRLQSTSNSYAKSMMIHLLSKQVNSFPTLAKETLRRLILSFCEQKSSAVKCQVLNLAFAVFQQSTSQVEQEDSEAGPEEQMLKYVLKVASLDENLIVK